MSCRCGGWKGKPQGKEEDAARLDFAGRWSEEINRFEGLESRLSLGLSWHLLNLDLSLIPGSTVAVAGNARIAGGFEHAWWRSLTSFPDGTSHRGCDIHAIGTCPKIAGDVDAGRFR